MRPTPGRGSACSQPVRELRRRAPRRRRGPGRRRAAPRRVLRRARGERRLASGTPGRVGRAVANRGGEPAGRHPLVPRPTTSRPCRTSSASSGCSGRCAIACRRAGPGSRSYCSAPTHWTTGPEPSCCSSRPSRPSRSVTTTARVAAVDGAPAPRGPHRRSVPRERRPAGRSRGSCRSSTTSTARSQAASTALDGFREPERALHGVCCPDRRDAGDGARPGRRRPRAPHRGRRARRPVRQQLARVDGTNVSSPRSRCSAGRLDEARALLVGSVDASDDTEVSTLTLTFSLVASAQLALAERRCTAGRDRAWVRPTGCAGEPACGRGRRSGEAKPSWSPAWRRRSIPTSSTDAFAAGSELDQREALALVRGD